jgi:hypothetical protein
MGEKCNKVIGQRQVVRSARWRCVPARWQYSGHSFVGKICGGHRLPMQYRNAPAGPAGSASPINASRLLRRMLARFHSIDGIFLVGYNLVTKQEVPVDVPK